MSQQIGQKHETLEDLTHFNVVLILEVRRILKPGEGFKGRGWEQTRIQRAVVINGAEVEQDHRKAINLAAERVWETSTEECKILQVRDYLTYQRCTWDGRVWRG